MRSSVALYPLRFQPLLRQFLWGGRRLGERLHKPIGGASDYAESWELMDHPAYQTTVAQGELAGVTLGELVREGGAAVLGRHAPLPRFPLLLKFLDACQTLSVQVHPNDFQASRLNPPDYGKTECWVVLEAEPGSRIYAGLREGVGPVQLLEALDQGRCEECLHSFEPRVGDCVFLPAGVVHAIGAGLLIAEIQQASDVTYRLFDWNRVGPDGKPRPLHLAQALEVIDFDYGPVHPQRPVPITAQCEHLIGCDKFVLNRWNLNRPTELCGDDRCHILAVIDGAAHVDGDPAEAPLSKGDSMLIPAAAGAVQINPVGNAVVLDAYLP